MSSREQLEQSLAGLESQRSFLGDAIVDPAIAAIHLQLSTLNSPRKSEKQRKQVTILFADVSGFTAMSEIMDAEDVRETMNALWWRVDQCILDYNGNIDKHIGDAVMAVWGVDEAREDDPELAIRAALKMQTAVYTFARQQNIALKMRIGLNTGSVFLGEVGITAEFTAMGDAVNIASRLERAAPIGGILISHAVYRHVRGLFDVEIQAPFVVKGKAEPLQTYVVASTATHRFRAQTRGVEGVQTRMIGRESELHALQTSWEQTLSTKHTTLLTIVGDAGVGKSRLLYEFEKWLDALPRAITLFRSRAAERTKGTPYFLLRDLLATRFDIRESDSIARVQYKFGSGIAEMLGSASEMKAHILGQWLGYDFSRSPHVIKIQDDAEQLKNRGLLYLSQFLTAAAGKRPLILFLEDIHWADRPSLEAILHVLQREPSLPIAIIAVTRPSLFEQWPTWQKLGESSPNTVANLQLNEPVYKLIPVAPLSVTTDRELLTEILQKVDPIPEDLFDLIAGRAEGNPFYMEEMVKMLIDNHIIMTGDDTWQVDVNRLHEHQIPSTLMGILQARLDKLEPNAMTTLQRASVIGRIFWDSAIEELGDDDHYVQLQPLQSREFVYKRDETSFAGTIEYLFKHDLLRDVTYQTVLKKARILYHRQVAVWLVTAAEKNGRSDEYATIIGDHHQAAGQMNHAAIWYGRAGRQAATSYAYKEAIYYLNLAVKFTAKENSSDHLSLLTAREKIYDTLGNRDAQKLDLEQLIILAADSDAINQAEVALRQMNYAYVVCDYDQVGTHASTIMERGQLGDSLPLAAEGYWIWGMAGIRQGQYPSAKKKFQMGLQLAQAAAEKKQIANCLKGLGVVVAIQGDYVAATAYFKQALAIYKKSGNQYGAGQSLNNSGIVATKQGNATAAKAYFEQSLTIHRAIGDRNGEGHVLRNLGIVAMAQKEHAVANGRFKQALAIHHEVNDRYSAGDSFNELGALALIQGDISLAETYYQQASRIHNELDLPHHAVEGWAGLAQVYLAQNDRENGLRYGEKILTHLKNNPQLGGTESRMRTFQFTWESLVALEKMDEANEVLALAAHGMQAYLDKNSEPASQKLYLSQPHHQVLWAAWIKKREGDRED